MLPWEAHSARRVFEAYRSGLLEYRRTPRADESLQQRRRTLCEMQPEVLRLAAQLRVDTCARVTAPGRPTRELNLIVLSIDAERLVSEGMPTIWPLDAIDRCVGAARSELRRSVLRAASPWWWPIDLAAMVLRVPFLILRGAGVPPSIEETLAAHIIKAALLASALALAGAMGLERTEALKTLFR